MKNEPQSDHYGVLGLEPGASDEEIRRQYRRLAKVFHPDRNNDDDWCREQITKINLAYAALTDPSQQKETTVVHYGREAWSETPEESEETLPSGFWKRLALPLMLLSFCLAAYAATAVRALTPYLAHLRIP